MKDELLDYIYKTNPLQKKKLLRQFNEEPHLHKELDDFFRDYSRYLTAKAITYQDLADAYFTMVNQMAYARLEFFRTGFYPRATQSEAVNEVYSNPQVMTTYMLGLALSQFLWKHHHKLFCFYREYLTHLQLGTNSKALEVGSGHGLFLLEVLNRFEDLSQMDVIDISQSSINISREIVQTINPKMASKVSFILQDISNHVPKKQYAFITMGEVLEHVEHPVKILQSLCSMLDKSGTAFISTCINCPAIDHVYHFKSVQEVRDMLQQAGFSIERDIIAPSECVPDEKLRNAQIDVSYGAIIRKATL